VFIRLPQPGVIGASRIERDGAKSLNSDTLVTLSEWMGTGVESLKKVPPPVVHDGRTVESTPDIDELHLRADKNLDGKAADLANLFRGVYEQPTQDMKKRQTVFFPFSIRGKGWEPKAVVLRRLASVGSGCSLDPWCLAPKVGLSVPGDSPQRQGHRDGSPG